jgi:hypothetical protein
MEELIAMSSKELDRLTILQKVVDKELKQKEAANLLKISERQVRTCLKRPKRNYFPEKRAKRP